VLLSVMRIQSCHYANQVEAKAFGIGWHKN